MYVCVYVCGLLGVSIFVVFAMGEFIYGLKSLGS